MKGLIILLCLSLCSCASKPWTRAEKALLITSCLATAADAITTERMLDRGNSELNPMLSDHPSDLKIGAYFVTAQSLIIVVVHYIPVLRKPLLVGKTIVGTSLAIHNESLGRRENND